MPSNAELKKYWDDMNARVIPILEDAAKLDPEGYELKINNEVLPIIYGTGTDITLKDVLGAGANQINGTSVAPFIGRNYNFRNPISRLFSYFHRFLLSKNNPSADDDVKIVVPIVFETVTINQASPEGYVDFSLTPQGYSSNPDTEVQYSTTKPLGRVIDEGLYNFYASSDYTRTYIPPRLDPKIVIHSDKSNLADLPDYARAKILSVMQQGFKNTLAELMDPTEYLEADSERGRSMQSLVGVFAASPAERDAMAENVAGYFCGPSCTSSPYINFKDLSGVTRGTILHELMHNFALQHPHENPKILAATRQIVEQLDGKEPMGASILNYPQVVNPILSIINPIEGILFPYSYTNEENPAIQNLRPHDLVLLSAGKYCTLDAITHNVSGVANINFDPSVPFNPTNPQLLKPDHQFKEFVEVDYEALRPQINPARRIAVDSLRSLCVELPSMLVEELLDAAGEKLPSLKRGGSSNSGIIFAIRSILMLSIYQLNLQNIGIAAAMNGGAAFLASDRCKSLVEAAVKKSGFDETTLYKLLEDAGEKYRKLPKPAQAFINQFFTSFSLSAGASIAFGNPLFLGSHVFYRSLQQADQAAISAVLTASVTGVMRAAIDFGKQKIRNATEEKPIELSEIFVEETNSNSANVLTVSNHPEREVGISNQGRRNYTTPRLKKATAEKPIELNEIFVEETNSNSANVLTVSDTETKDKIKTSGFEVRRPPKLREDQDYLPELRSAKPMNRRGAATILGEHKSNSQTATLEQSQKGRAMVDDLLLNLPVKSRRNYTTSRLQKPTELKEILVEEPNSKATNVLTVSDTETKDKIKITNKEKPAGFGVRREPRLEKDPDDTELRRAAPMNPKGSRVDSSLSNPNKRNK